MFTTSLNSNGRVIVIDDEITDDTPQNFTVSVKNETDWEEIHNYIINDVNSFYRLCITLRPNVILGGYRYYKFCLRYTLYRYNDIGVNLRGLLRK